MAGATAFAEMPEIIALPELQEGMQGTGYTVIDASGEIRPFNAEVIGIMGSGKLASPRILVNVSGAVMEETGGAISGMSGSPIYFNGRLAGALSAGFTDMYTKRIMLTPIEDMLKIWDYPDRKNKTKLPTMNLKEARAELAKMEEEAKAKEEAKNPVKELRQAVVAEAAGEENAAEAESVEEQKVPLETEKASAADDALYEENEKTDAIDNEEAVDEAVDEAVGEEAADDADVDAAAGEDENYQSRAEMMNADEVDEAQPEAEAVSDVEEKSMVLTSGFGSTGLKYLHQQMAALGLRFTESDTWGADSSNDRVVPGATLLPGSPVGVSLAMGDFSYGAIGTVTAVDGNRILAFGHPFTHRGNVNYFMTGSSILSTVHGPTSGKKLGEMGSIIGRINQDRENGVAGVLGEYPQVVPVIVSVTDKDTERSVTYHSVLAYDEEVVPVLAPVIAYSSLSNTLDRENPSTVELKFTLRTNVMKTGKIERGNMFYADTEVGKLAVSELTDVLKVLAENRDQESDLLDLKVDITVDNARKTAYLVSAVPSKTEVLPGEKITLETTVKPYRGEKFKVSVPFTVPETQAAGNLALDIHGGGLVNVTKILMAQQAAQEAAANAPEVETVSTEEKLTEMLKSKHNNDIVVETTVAVPKNDGELKDAIKKAKKLAERLAKQGQAAAKKQNDQPDNSLSTEYIIENVIHASVKVLEQK